jgi:hypothetical protein
MELFHSDVTEDLQPAFEHPSAPVAMFNISEQQFPSASQRRALDNNFLLPPATSTFQRTHIPSMGTGHSSGTPFGILDNNPPYTPLSASSSAPHTPNDVWQQYSAADEADRMLVEHDPYGFTPLAKLPYPAQHVVSYNQVTSIVLFATTSIER